VARARRALALLDLSDLSASASEASAKELSRRALTPHGPVAALCVYPRFVKAAKAALGPSTVKLATVANFPDGGEDTSAIEAEVVQALADGADEIDMVMPWRAFLKGRRGFVETQILRIRWLLPSSARLRVTLETGKLKTPDAIREASWVAVNAGAQMITTSTGKVPLNATPRAAELVLQVLRDSKVRVGFTAAGEIRTLQKAQAYLELADRIMGPDWAAPQTFRLGATGLLDELIQVIEKP